MSGHHSVTNLAKTNARGEGRVFGIYDADRDTGVHILGKSGMGKSSLLESMFIQDMQKGHGCCFIDPHGQHARSLIQHAPRWRSKDVVYLDAGDFNHPFGFNAFDTANGLLPQLRALAGANLSNTFRKLFDEGAWGDRTEHYFRNAALALMEYPGGTLFGVQRMFLDDRFLQHVLKRVTDPSVLGFWIDEYYKKKSVDPRFVEMAISPLQNKMGKFFNNPILRNILAQKKTTFGDFRYLMDNRKIVIVNLSQGGIGEQATNLLGSLFMMLFYYAALTRDDIDESQRVPFYLYSDEVENFVHDGYSNMLSQLRKYRMPVTLANQFVKQLSPEFWAAIRGNIGTQIAFRVGPHDAKELNEDFLQVCEPASLANLGLYEIYIRMQINKVQCKPFSAQTLPPPVVAENPEGLIRYCRNRYTTPRSKIEQQVKKALRR